MKSLIIIASLVLLAVTVHAQSTYQPFSTHNQQRHLGTPRSFDPPPIPRQPTPYPPDYFTIPSYGVQVPSGPTTGYPGLRGYDERTGIWVPSPYTNSW